MAFRPLCENMMKEGDGNKKAFSFFIHSEAYSVRLDEEGWP